MKRVAVFCIIKSGDQYLLLKRAKVPNQGKFVPVGGKIDPYESPLQAVIRGDYRRDRNFYLQSEILRSTHGDFTNKLLIG
ncbi:MAG: NUDIX domain-containing protein [Saprospiraceae bacterium]|nr:NUDIX domain-containing protein [Saprospiraceae bacterium]